MEDVTNLDKTVRDLRPKNNNFELHVSCGLHDICSLSININVYTREDNEMSNVRCTCLLPCDKTFLKKKKRQ